MKYLPLIAILFCLTNVSSVAAKEPSPKLTNVTEAVRYQISCLGNAYFSKAKNSSSKKELAKTAINSCLAERKVLVKFFSKLLDKPLEVVLESEESVIKSLDDLYDKKTSDMLKIIALITVVQENCKSANRTGIEESKQHLHNRLSEEFAYYRSPEIRIKAINGYTPEMKDDFLAKGEAAWCQEMKEFSSSDPEVLRKIFKD